jgi:diguanylate cyclase
MSTLTPTRDFLDKLADSVTHAQTLEQLVRPLLELLQAVTGLESTYLTTIDGAAGVQHVLFASNSRRLRIPEGLSVPWEGTLCKRALEEERVYAEDVGERWGDCDAARALGIASYASTPVRMRDGALYGTLCAASDERVPLAEGAPRMLRMFSQLIAQQVERERTLQALRLANEALAASALTDATTRLPNRRALIEEMHRRQAAHAVDGRVLVAAFVDLDGFKAVNDRHGHDAGDRFLAAIGGRLQEALQPDGFVARLGGDEFVALSNARRDGVAEAVSRLHARLLEAASGMFALDAVTIDYAGPSIGIAAAESARDEPTVLLARADAAMYEAKRRRKAVATA